MSPDAMQEQVVVLRVRWPADGDTLSSVLMNPPAQWNWPELIDGECEVIAAGPVNASA